jgi:hypothetical protein
MYHISDNLKNKIDAVIDECKLGDKGRKYWKKHYITLKKSVTNIGRFISKGDIIKCGDKFYFKMTYMNMERFATEEQMNAYHALQGGSKNVKIESMNVASMIVPVYGGKRKQVKQ